MAHQSETHSENATTLDDLTIDELLNRTDGELQYAQQIIDGGEERYATLADGTKHDLLASAIVSARSSLIVAHGRRSDTESSASRQCYIDTGDYLPNQAVEGIAEATADAVLTVARERIPAIIAGYVAHGYTETDAIDLARRDLLGWLDDKPEGR